MSSIKEPEARINPPETTSSVAFVEWNRNLCNYSLARDPRTTAHWAISTKTGKPIAALPGNKRIKLRLPKGCAKRLKRCPDGFDVLVLSTLLRLAQMSGDPVVKLKSKAALIKELRVPRYTGLHAKLNAALELWQNLTLIFGGSGKHRCWYPKQAKAKILPPPIEILKGQSRLHLKISPDWMELAEHGFFVQVVHPLPTKAPMQSLVLWAMTAIPLTTGPDSRTTQPKTQRDLCRIIGVNHKTRNTVLRRTIEEAGRWFAEYGGKFSELVHSRKIIKFGKSMPADGIIFEIKEPPIPKVKKSEPTFAMEILAEENKKPLKKAKPPSKTVPKKKPWNGHTAESQADWAPGEDW